MAKTQAQSIEKNLAETAATHNMDNCPVVTAIEVIGGKWTIIILYQLRGKTLRFGEIKKAIPKITQKMLTQQLRELEANKLVTRKVYAEVPPRVEYSPTALAEKLNPALDLLCKWGREYQNEQGSPIE
jgi:DNA-binding HxlR family transcriptional regulator